MASSTMCDVCKENDNGQSAAVMRCMNCQHFLCQACKDKHRDYYRRHKVYTLEELAPVPNAPSSRASHLRIDLGNISFKFVKTLEQEKIFVNLQNISCDDVTLTIDKSVLLAAGENGLYEIDAEKNFLLSHWSPPLMLTGVQKESVAGVAALRDGRAAIILLNSKLVVLLKRRIEYYVSDQGIPRFEWVDDHVFGQLPWSPSYLSANEKMLAVCGSIEQSLCILNLSSEKPEKGRRNREYYISCLAIATHAVFTGSSHKVKLKSGSLNYVVDEHSLSDDNILRRYTLDSNTKELHEICVDPIGSVLLACVNSSSGSRVIAFSSKDINNSRDVFTNCSLISRLSLLEIRTAAQDQESVAGCSSHHFYLVMLDNSGRVSIYLQLGKQTEVM